MFFFAFMTLTATTITKVGVVPTLDHEIIVKLKLLLKMGETIKN